MGKPFTENRITALRHDVRIAEVQGNDVRLQPGLSFTLTGHPRIDLNAHWRVNTVIHKGTQFTSLQEEAADVDASTRYEQTAVLVPGRTEWRPAPLEKPRIDGPHMATVVGPPGEEIYCDEWGRVKVSFPWDRESQNNEFSSCWLRVSQSWAGGSWGAMAIPRIGQDVIIQYVNGDPDQPMITGRTYCGDQLPPYDLPDHKTRMTIKSQTHKGDGFNELRFEDELGKEEVFVHAQKDQNTLVNNNQSLSVGVDRTHQIGQDESVAIGRNRLRVVKANDIDPAQKSLQFRYNRSGRLVERTDAMGYSVKFRYDAYGRLLQLINENGESYRFGWDELDRLVAQQDLDGSGCLYAYNVLDEVTRLTHVPSPDEQPPLSDNAPPTRTTAIRHDFERDAIGRLLSKRTEDGTTDYGYDAADNLLSITFTDNKGEQQQLDYTYDANGQLLSETNSAGLLQYRYDELGNLQTLVLPDQRELNHLYYGSGHLHQINLNGRVISDFEHDEVLRTQGQLITRTRYKNHRRLTGSLKKH